MNPLTSRFQAELRAMHDVMYFVEDSQFMGSTWLWPSQKQALTKFYDANAGLRDMCLIWGMRSGKTTVASMISCYEAFKLINVGYPCKKYGLPKGTEIFIINVATSDRQAKDTVFAHVKARIDNSEWFKSQNFTEHYNEFIFPVKDATVIIRSEHSNSASLAGKTIICSVFDELSRFKDTGGNSSAEMVYDTLSRSVRTFGNDGKRVIITSPMLVDDFAMELYHTYKENPHWYCSRLPTWECNPTISFADLSDEFEKNPETAWRDYGAVPSSAIEAYFKEKERVDKVFTLDEPPIMMKEGLDVLTDDWRLHPDIPCILAGDPSLKNDAFGLALIYEDQTDNRLKVPLLHQFIPENTGERREIDAGFVKEFIMELSKRCWIRTFVTDTWMFPETIQGIRDSGIQVLQHHVGKEEYDYLKEKIYTVGIDVCKYPIVARELKSLEITRGKKIDHPKRGSKDVADALANAVWHSREEVAGSGEAPVMVTFQM